MTIKVVHLDTIQDDVAEEALRFIAEGLRVADREELEAVLEGDPGDILVTSWRISTDTWLILDRTGLPVGAFGVAPHPAEGVGVAWLLGTDGMEREALAIARQTPRYVQEMHKDYEVLWNYVDARNALSMRWLDRAGFTIGDIDLEHGLEARPFFMFVRHR